MRLALIVVVLALTAYTFFLATSLPQANADNNDTAAMQALVEEAEALANKVSDLEAENADQKSQILAMAATQVEPDQALIQAMEQLEATGLEHDNLVATNSELGAKVSLLIQQKGLAEEALLAAETEIATLADTVESERAALEALQAELSVSADGVDNASESRLVEMQTIVEEANVALAAAEQRIASLTTDAGQHASVVATLSSQVTTAEGEITSLKTELAGLTNAIAAGAGQTEVEVIETRNADSCTARTTTVLADTKLNFDRGTATIASDTVPVLATLVDVARGCADANLVLEIGGHTDSQGGEISNQTLSENRARAVLDFLYSEGVPSVAMRAVGYGESKPIADNATSDGRAENRRITFDWQQR